MEEEHVPFFFDLSSLAPLVERNPFEPLLVRDELPVEVGGAIARPELTSGADFGLPIPDSYDFDMMQALVQDPFRLYVYWHLRDNPQTRLQRIFPTAEAGQFQLVLRLIDETNNITVFFDAPYAREYWFSVFPDRLYRVELGLRSPHRGYIKLLGSSSVRTPRGGPSDQVAAETEYQIGADDYLRVLRESHLIPERAWVLDGVLPALNGAPAGELTGMWEALPPTFRRLMRVIGDIQAGREYDKWWERLGQEELAGLVREFLAIIREMGDGEMGYMLLMRYLPELLRRAILAEGRAEDRAEVRIDKPVALFLAEQLGQASSEMGPGTADEGARPGGGAESAPRTNQSISMGSMGPIGSMRKPLPGLTGN
jgi:hypothetical protein